MRYVKINIKLNSNIKPPYFIGSQIRGAFGYAFKKVLCINPNYKCQECFANYDCLYYKFYEEKNIFHKYRFDIILGKNKYDFNMFLFDDATKKLPYVVAALNMMLKDIGLGVEHDKFDKFDIYINGKACVKNNTIELPKFYIEKFKIDDFEKNIKLKFITPLRIKKNNKFVRNDEIELKDIVNSIYNRQMQILGRENRRFPYEVKGDIVHKDIRYEDLTRKSNRQKTKMNIGGIMGEIKVTSLNQETYNVLRLGELLAVGKQTVFGLGKIKVRKEE